MVLKKLAKKGGYVPSVRSIVPKGPYCHHLTHFQDLIYCYYFLQAFLSLSYQMNNTKVNEIVTEILKHIPCGKNKSEKKYTKRLKQRLKKSLQV